MTTYEISIPKGSIKRHSERPRPWRIAPISIPKGSIKRWGRRWGR